MGIYVVVVVVATPTAASCWSFVGEGKGRIERESLEYSIRKTELGSWDHDDVPFGVGHW